MTQGSMNCWHQSDGLTTWHLLLGFWDIRDSRREFNGRWWWMVCWIIRFTFGRMNKLVRHGFNKTVAITMEWNGNTAHKMLNCYSIWRVASLVIPWVISHHSGGFSPDSWINIAFGSFCILLCYCCTAFLCVRKVTSIFASFCGKRPSKGSKLGPSKIPRRHLVISEVGFPAAFFS